MSTSISAHPAGYNSVLRVPGLRPVFIAHGVSMAGSVAAEVALAIMIFERTRSPLLSALVLVCSFLPYALGGAVLSSIADRFPARPVLVCCDLICAAAIAAMLIPGMPVAGLLALLLVTGVVAPIFAGARAASLAHLLDAELFPVGRSLLRAIGQLTILTGLAIGSVAVAAVGPSWLLTLDAASFAASAVLIGVGTPSTPRSGTATRSTVRESLAGLGYVFGNPRLRRLVVLSWVVPAFSSMPDGLAVAYTGQLGVAASLAGALLTGYAVGSIVGELVASRLSPRVRRRLVVPLILLTQVPAIAFVAEPPVAVAAVLLAISGSGYAFNQGIDPLVLAAVEPAYRGRLFTVQTSGLMAIQGVGIALACSAR
ncbi:MFS transporter [Kribbella monticola]|uniref:MFS transporter n=1 Tax=Kribbella monticola TaxID=2185285 RepID=UPI001E5C8F3A|nr:MFS transporter [Kribbella monticola]